MKKFYKMLCFGTIILLPACTPDIQTIDLSTVPDIPENMIYEQKNVHKELEKDKQQILKDIKNQEEIGK